MKVTYNNASNAGKDRQNVTKTDAVSTALQNETEENKTSLYITWRTSRSLITVAGHIPGAETKFRKQNRTKCPEDVHQTEAGLGLPE
jgi:hypothetical protein